MSSSRISARSTRTRRPRAPSRRARRPRPARGSATGVTTSWAIRSPTRDRERLGAVRVQQQHAQLAAVAGVDQPGRVDERDPVARRGPRARQDEPGVPGRDRDRDARADARRARRAAARRPRRRSRSRPASPSCARVGATAASLSRVNSITRARGMPRCRSTSKRSKRCATPAGTRARISAPLAVSSRSSSPASSCSSDSEPPSAYGTSSSIGRSDARKRPSIVFGQLLEPLPRDGRHLDGLRVAEGQLLAALVVEHVDLVEHQQPRHLGGAGSRPAPRRRRRAGRAARPPPARRRRRARSGRR